MSLATPSAVGFSSQCSLPYVSTTLPPDGVGVRKVSMCLDFSINIKSRAGGLRRGMYRVAANLVSCFASSLKWSSG